MITYNNDEVRLYGLSTDAKPTDGIENGTTFVEMDTSDEYFYNEDGGEWVKKNSSGGGGAFKVTASNYLSDTATLPNGTTLDKTFAEITAAAKAGQVVTLPLGYDMSSAPAGAEYVEAYYLTALEAMPGEYASIAFSAYLQNQMYTIWFTEIDGVLTYAS